jgi:hypothetical protein
MGCSKSIPRQPRTTLDWELPLPTREGSLEQCHNRNLSSVKKVGRFMGKMMVLDFWGLGVKPGKWSIGHGVK